MLHDFSGDQFDVIIQAGQSNSEGCGQGDAAKPFQPNPRIWYLDGDFVITPAAERVIYNQIWNNFSLRFAEEYINAGLLAPDRKLLIIRAAIGGTGFADHRWGPEDDLFLRLCRLIETAAALNPQNRFTALLWHQGENETGPNASLENHYTNLRRLVSLVRDLCKAPSLPFIAGNFVEEWRLTHPENCMPIIEAMRKLCAEDPCADFVETDGLMSNRQVLGGEDDIHFCREAQNQLGERYFRAFEALRGGAGAAGLA